MYQHYDHHFGREIYSIHPGEYYVTGEDVIISTVLGSCIAVALFDPKVSIGGLNHFMLPDTDRIDFASESGKYGMYAMELLINEMLKAGCERKRFIAKVFGGGSVLNLNKAKENAIPLNNIKFAMNYLRTEKISVVATDVGGTNARKIFVYPKNSKVLLKRIQRTMIKEIEREEVEYLSSLRSEKAKSWGEFTDFRADPQSSDASRRPSRR